MGKNLIIAFLLGMLVMSYAHAMKVPDVILGKNIDPDLKEIIEDYVIPILNKSRYQCEVTSSAIASATELDSGEFLMDDSAATKKWIVSNGTDNYYVNLTKL